MRFEPLTAMRAIDDSKLPPQHKALACLYCRFANSFGESWPGARVLGAKLSRHERTVRATQADLVEWGVLVPVGNVRRAPKFRINPHAASRYMPLDSQQSLFMRASDPHSSMRANRPGHAGQPPGSCGPTARLTAHELLMNCSLSVGSADALPADLTPDEVFEAVIDAWLLLHEQRRASRTWTTKSGRPKGYPRGRPQTVPTQLRAAAKIADSVLDLVLVMRWAFEGPDFDCKVLRGEVRQRDPVRLDLASLFRHRDGQFERRLALARQWAEDGAPSTVQRAAGAYDGPTLDLTEDEERAALAELAERARCGDAF